jgi:hypothetical protein
MHPGLSANGHSCGHPRFQDSDYGKSCREDLFNFLCFLEDMIGFSVIVERRKMPQDFLSRTLRTKKDL